MLASRSVRSTLPYYPAVRTITVEGRSVAYQDGGGAGPPVLLVHGLGANLSFWRYTVPALTSSYRTLAIDLPGFGLSDKNDVPGTIGFFVESIARFLDALGVEQVYYVGLSMGGQVGLAFAQHYRHRVRRLALISSAGFEAFKPHEAALIKSMTRCAGVLTSDPVSIRRHMTLNVARWRPAYQWLVTQRRALAERPDYAAYMTANSRALAGMLDAPVADALGGIRVPVLAFFGTDDKLIPNRYLHPALTPQDIAAEAQAVLPRASVHLVDAAGHLLMIERPDPVNEALRAFLDDGEMARRRNVT